MMKRCFLMFAATGFLFCSAAQAEVLDLRNLVATEATLAHHYTFEGDASSRLNDLAGDLDLSEMAYGSGSTTGIAYDAGWSAGNTAFTSQRLGSGTTGGAALIGSTIDIGSALTIEALIKTDTVAGGGNAFAVVAGKYPNRGYFLYENDSNQLGAWVGSGRQTFLDTTPGDWYYVAAVYSHDGTNTSIDTYTANLTQGDDALTHAHLAQSGFFGSGPQHLGIGAFATESGTLQEAFAGSMDEVAIYNSALSATTIQNHFDTLVIPEPSTFVLLLGLVMGGAAASLVRRP